MTASECVRVSGERRSYRIIMAAAVACLYCSGVGAREACMANACLLAACCAAQALLPRSVQHLFFTAVGNCSDVGDHR